MKQRTRRYIWIAILILPLIAAGLVSLEAYLLPSMVWESSAYIHALEKHDFNTLVDLIRKNPNNQEYQLGAVTIADYIDESNRLKPLIEKKLLRGRGLAAAHVAIAESYTRDNRKEKTRHLQAAIEADPQNAAIAYLLAVELYRSGRAGEADALFRKANAMPRLDLYPLGAPEHSRSLSVVTALSELFGSSFYSMWRQLAREQIVLADRMMRAGDAPGAEEALVNILIMAQKVVDAKPQSYIKASVGSAIARISFSKLDPLLADYGSKQQRTALRALEAQYDNSFLVIRSSFGSMFKLMLPLCEKFLGLAVLVSFAAGILTASCLVFALLPLVMAALWIGRLIRHKGSLWARPKAKSAVLFVLVVGAGALSTIVAIPIAGIVIISFWNELLVPLLVIGPGVICGLAIPIAALIRRKRLPAEIAGRTSIAKSLIGALGLNVGICVWLLCTPIVMCRFCCGVVPWRITEAEIFGLDTETRVVAKAMAPISAKTEAFVKTLNF